MSGDTNLWDGDVPHEAIRCPVCKLAPLYYRCQGPHSTLNRQARDEHRRLSVRNALPDPEPHAFLPNFLLHRTAYHRLAAYLAAYLGCARPGNDESSRPDAHFSDH